MREIKFRAWDKDAGKYTHGMEGPYVDILEVGTGTYRIEQRCPGRYIIEQYTGLKDKNGTEIAVGDIVKYDHGFGIYHVVYRKWDSSFVLEDDNREEIIHLRLDEEPRYEVIGNIHENKDLLGEKDD